MIDPKNNILKNQVNPVYFIPLNDATTLHKNCVKDDGKLVKMPRL